MLNGRQPEQIAQELLQLVAQIWARVLNHKPRADKGGRSRAQLYEESSPTDEQRAQAEAALRERLRKQQLAAQTRQARLDPVVRRSLDDAFARLALDDPDGNLRDAIATYPPNAVLNGVATYEGKRKAGTLPPQADGRYLLGIVRNITHQDEGLRIAEALWRARLAAHDHVLEQLDRVRRRCQDDLTHDPTALLIGHIDRALATDRQLDRFFWLQAAVDVALAQPASLHRDLFQTAARRIHTTYRVPHHQRLQASRYLAAKMLPVD